MREFSMETVLLNSGAPASTAPPDFSSLGMMVSQRNIRVAYCAAEKYFGVYAPACAAAFSLCTIWWTYSAASAGMICSTEPAAAPKGRVRRVSRRGVGLVGRWLFVRQRVGGEKRR